MTKQTQKRPNKSNNYKKNNHCKVWHQYPVSLGLTAALNSVTDVGKKQLWKASLKTWQILLLLKSSKPSWIASDPNVPTHGAHSSQPLSEKVEKQVSAVSTMHSMTPAHAHTKKKPDQKMTAVNLKGSPCGCQVQRDKPSQCRHCNKTGWKTMPAKSRPCHQEDRE